MKLTDTGTVQLLLGDEAVPDREPVVFVATFFGLEELMFTELVQN